LTTPAKIGKVPQKMKRFFSQREGLPHTEVRDVAAGGSGVYALAGEHLCRLEKGTFKTIAELEGARSIALYRGRVFICSGSGFYEIEEDRVARHLEGDYVKAVLGPRGTLWILSRDKVVEWSDKVLGEVRLPDDRGEPRSLAVDSSGTIWVATGDGLLSYRDGEWRRYTADGENGLLSSDVRAVAVDSVGHLWVGTSRGVNVFCGGGWETLTGRDGLPYEDVTTIFLSPNGDRWFGTAAGAARLRKGKWSFFAPQRWLPNEYVTAITVDAGGAAWVATRGGLARLWEVYMSLEEKAAHYERLIRKYHVRMGFVNPVLLDEPGDLSSWRHEVTDNDGLWTGLYLAAECFRYAATGDPEAKRNAIETFQAMERLVRVTGIKGFPARAIARRGEYRGAGGEWHPIPGEDAEWKGDTSSDEIVGHFFAYTVFYQLIDEPEWRQRVTELVHDIADHIIRHGYYLVDVDGKPTTWGVWSPEKLNDDPEWWRETGLNALEILAILKAAYKMTGDRRFQEAYEELVRKHHYALNTIRQKITVPGEVNHSDDELAFLSYYVLLSFEDDPDLRAIYLLSLEKSWRIERPERNPLWNFIYGALSGNDCDVEAGIQTLIEIPLDTVEWTMKNSHRSDVEIAPSPNRHGRLKSKEVLPYDERAITRWNADPYQLDDGKEGRRMLDGTHWLLPYWMGRYYGFIKE